LNASLDVFTVRKLGVPGHQELGMVQSPTAVFEYCTTASSGIWDIATERIDIGFSKTEEEELQRRDGCINVRRPTTRFENRTVIIVDDGLATGSTMESRRIRAIRIRKILRN